MPVVKLFGIEIIIRRSADACKEKVNYHTVAKAVKAVNKQKALGNIRFSYHCPHCGGYHLTKIMQ